MLLSVAYAFTMRFYEEPSCSSSNYLAITTEFNQCTNITDFEDGISSSIFVKEAQGYLGMKLIL